MANRISEDEIRTALEGLDGWSYAGDALRKTFQFRNHREAIGFVVRLSFEAEERNHHAEIFNVYSKVELTLRTHDAGNRVTMLDVELARAIESIARR